MAFEHKDGMVVESVYFNGRKYNRYPNSNNAAHKRYFARAGARLHREVWKFYYGSIPRGFQIHHKDRDTTNNDISNLECLPFKKHRNEHLDEYIKRGRSSEQLAHLAAIQPRTKEWHASAEGREWHRQHAANTLHQEGSAKPYSKMVPRDGKCEWCGSPFKAKSYKRSFCSASCQFKVSAARRGLRRSLHPYYASRLQSDG
jgi:hypothetical protein